VSRINGLQKKCTRRSFTPLIDEVVGTARQRAEQNKNRLVVEAPADLGALTVDPTQTSIAIGDLQLRAGDLAGAKKSYEDAFEDDQQARLLAHAVYFAQENEPAKRALVDALGALAWSALLTNHAEAAAESAEVALKLDSSAVPIDLKRAHAYLLLGRKAIYLTRKDTPKTSASTETYADDIRHDFDQFRQRASRRLTVIAWQRKSGFEEPGSAAEAQGSPHNREVGSRVWRIKARSHRIAGVFAEPARRRLLRWVSAARVP
jgi:tetratricopeptide (TPR) repeat protein